MEHERNQRIICVRCEPNLASKRNQNDFDILLIKVINYDLQITRNIVIIKCFFHLIKLTSWYMNYGRIKIDSKSNENLCFCRGKCCDMAILGIVTGLLHMKNTFGGPEISIIGITLMSTVCYSMILLHIGIILCTNKIIKIYYSMLKLATV